MRWTQVDSNINKTKKNKNEQTKKKPEKGKAIATAIHTIQSI